MMQNISISIYRLENSLNFASKLQEPSLRKLFEIVPLEKVKDIQVQFRRNPSVGDWTPCVHRKQVWQLTDPTAGQQSHMKYEDPEGELLVHVGIT